MSDEAKAVLENHMATQLWNGAPRFAGSLAYVHMCIAPTPEVADCEDVMSLWARFMGMDASGAAAPVRDDMNIEVAENNYIILTYLDEAIDWLEVDDETATHILEVGEAEVILSYSPRHGHEDASGYVDRVIAGGEVARATAAVKTLPMRF